MMAWVDDQLDFVVAQCACELTINDPTARDDAGKPARIIRRAETNLGDLIADAFRARSGAEVGVACAGGIRMGLPKGQKRPVHGRGGRVPGQKRHDLGRTAGDGQDLHLGVPGFYTDKPRRRPDRLRWCEDDLAGDVPDYGVVAEYLHEDLDGIVGEDYANPYGQGRIVAVG